MPRPSRFVGAFLSISLVAMPPLASIGCGGSSQSSTVFVPDDDPEMQRAIADALRQLPKLDAAIEAGRARCFVKGAFSCPNGEVELCWILVEGKRDDAYHGTLNVIPENLPSLREGSPVRIAVKDAVDWMIATRGGPIEGNFTLRALLPRMSAEEAAAAKRAMGWR